ncbi:hypothetical protein PT2222_170086 [Paraburkholderia tropica]
MHGHARNARGTAPRTPCAAKAASHGAPRRGCRCSAARGLRPHSPQGVLFHANDIVTGQAGQGVSEYREFLRVIRGPHQADNVGLWLPCKKIEGTDHATRGYDVVFRRGRHDAEVQRRRG